MNRLVHLILKFWQHWTLVLSIVTYLDWALHVRYRTGSYALHAASDDAPPFSWQFALDDNTLRFKMMQDNVGYDLALIDEVKRHPILYDSFHIDARSSDVKLEVWRQITFLLKKSKTDKAVSMVRNRWKSLRDTLVKEIRYKNQEGNRPKKNWRYAHKMSFLIPYLSEPNPRKGNKRWKKTGNRDSKQVGDPQEPAKDFNETVHELGEVSRSHNAEDDIDVFFRGIADTVKKLTEKHQVKVQREIANIVLDAKLWEIPEEDDSL